MRVSRAINRGGGRVYVIRFKDSPGVLCLIVAICLSVLAIAESAKWKGTLMSAHDPIAPAEHSSCCQNVKTFLCFNLTRLSSASLAVPEWPEAAVCDD